MEPYGAPWLQPVAINRKRTTPKDGYKPTPLPSVATHCLRCSMVRRGSTVRVRQRALQKRCNGHFSVQADLHMLQTAVGMEPFVEPSGRGSALVRRQNCLFALVPHSEEHADAGHDCSEGTVEWATRSPVLPRRPKPTSCPPYAVWSGSCSRVTGSFLLRARCGQRDRRSLRGVSSERCRSPQCISVRTGTANSRPFAASRYSKRGGCSLLRRGATNGKRTPK